MSFRSFLILSNSIRHTSLISDNIVSKAVFKCKQNKNKESDKKMSDSSNYNGCFEIFPGFLGYFGVVCEIFFTAINPLSPLSSKL